MDYLKDGIGLRAMAQRDPLVEYQREGYALFQSMMGQIREETVGFLFNLEVEVQGQVGAAEAPVIAAKGLEAEKQPQAQLAYSAPNIDGEVEVRNQRGQLEKGATAKAQKAQDEAERSESPEIAAARAAGGPAARQTDDGKVGAFGQKTGGSEAPVNRAERRASGKKTR
jgi:preprotein translocase subunit SecA